MFDVADLSSVWVQAQLYEDDLAFPAHHLLHLIDIGEAAGGIEGQV